MPGIEARAMGRHHERVSWLLQDSEAKVLQSVCEWDTATTLQPQGQGHRQVWQKEGLLSGVGYRNEFDQGDKRMFGADILRCRSVTQQANKANHRARQDNMAHLNNWQEVQHLLGESIRHFTHVWVPHEHLLEQGNRRRGKEHHPRSISHVPRDVQEDLPARDME